MFFWINIYLFIVQKNSYSIKTLKCLLLKNFVFYYIGAKDTFS